MNDSSIRNTLTRSEKAEYHERKWETLDCIKFIVCTRISSDRDYARETGDQ